MKDHPQRKSKMNRQIIEEAAYWATCVEDEPLTIQEREEFALWLRGSPNHIKEFLLAQAISKDAAAIDPDKLISVEALLEKIDANVVPLESNNFISTAASPLWRKFVPLWRNSTMPGAVAAVIAFIAFATIVTATYLFETKEIIYATALGEQHSFVLEDGSVAHLNTQSKIRVRYDQNNRTIDLLQGEALFKVTPDPDKPFRVHSGTVTTKALGTTFNVYLKDKATEVAVIEGKVNISLPSNNVGAILNIGEKAWASPDGAIRTTQIAKLETIAAWRTRQLVFEDTPLTEIIHEFNRYNQTQINIEGPIVAEPRFSGVFNVDNPNAFLATLKASEFAVVIREGHDSIVIRLIPPHHPI